MGLELELLPSHHQLPPIRTAGTGDDDNDAADVVDGGCATPKSAASVLRAPSTCPPAPRKRRPAKRKQQLPTTTHHRACSCSASTGSAASRPAQVRWFIAVPHDVLAAVFVARPASAPCPSSTSPPASKKIRVHVVG